MSYDRDWIVEILDRDTHPDAEAVKCERPWGVVWPDNTVEWFDTEDDACARQVEIGKEGTRLATCTRCGKVVKLLQGRIGHHADLKGQRCKDIGQPAQEIKS